MNMELLKISGNQIGNKILQVNLFHKWINLIPNHTKVKELVDLNSIRRSIKSISGKTIYNNGTDNGPIHKIEFDKDQLISNVSYIKRDNSYYTRKFDDYSATKKVIGESYDNKGRLIRRETSTLDGFGNILNIKTFNPIEKTQQKIELNNEIRQLNLKCTLIELNKESKKIKYYKNDNEKIVSKKVYLNNKTENTVRNFSFDESLNILKSNKNQFNKNDKSILYESREYYYSKNNYLLSYQTRREYKYNNGKDQIIESINEYDYDENGNIIRETFKNLSYGSKMVLQECNYDKYSNILNGKYGTVQESYSYNFDDCSNWIERKIDRKSQNQIINNYTKREIEYY